jgi:septum site-determining protein MinC
MAMNQARKPLEIKISTVVAVAALLGVTDHTALSDALTQITGGTPDYFEDEFTLLDFGTTAPEPAPGSIDWPALIALFKSHRLNPVAVRNAPAALEAEIRAQGLAIDTMAAAKPAETAVPVEAAAPSAPVQMELQAAPVVTAKAEPIKQQEATPASAVQTMIIDTPVRAGQRVYARGCDLVVMAVVNPGGEVIADGSIHVYAPLRGRALAGASGNAKARIFSMVMEAELVSIAGVYRTFDEGWPKDLAKKPAQVALIDDRLNIKPINIT